MRSPLILTGIVAFALWLGVAGFAHAQDAVESAPLDAPSAAANIVPAQAPASQEPKSSAAVSQTGTAAAPPAMPADPASALPAVSADAMEELSDTRQRQMEDQKIAVLRTIDKLSARTHTFEVPVGKTVKFGSSLYISVRACRTASPLDQPENAAFLQIWERKSNQDSDEEADAKWIFSGWMFSSSPSVSAMDHPIYDVWVIDCKNDKTIAKSEVYESDDVAVDAVPAGGANIPADKPASTAKADLKDGATADGSVAPGTAPTPAQMAPVEPVGGGGAAMPKLQDLPGSFEDDDAVITAPAGDENNAASPQD